MLRHFNGSRLVKRIAPLEQAGRNRIDVEIHEEWREVVTSTAHCGNEQSYTAERTLGVSEKQSSSLKSAVESSMGIKDVLAIKSNIEATTGLELNWNESRTVKHTFSLKPPECGRHTQVICQLVRTYRFKYFRRGWLSRRDSDWVEKWRQSVDEWTENYDTLQDVEKDDETCGCDAKHDDPARGFDGRISLNFGTVSLRAAYRKEGGTCRIETFGVQLAIPVGPGEMHAEDWASPVRLSEADVPDVLWFLAALEPHAVDAVVTRLPEVVVTARYTELFAEDAVAHGVAAAAGNFEKASGA